MEVEGWSLGAAGSAASGVLAQDLFILLRVARAGGPGVSGWHVEAESCSSGAVWSAASGALTEDRLLLLLTARGVGLGRTDWSVGEVGWSSGAVGSKAPGLLAEDLRALARVARDVGSEGAGCCAGMGRWGWGVWAAQESEAGAILEEGRHLTPGFGGKVSSSEDMAGSGACCLPVRLALGMAGSEDTRGERGR